jgi:hypothetical protein
MVSGSCICGDVSFEIEGDDFEVIQCHCSICRKVTGSTADAMIVIPEDKFHWISGAEKISLYKFASGRERSFCKVCGGTVPRKDSAQRYWVPAGILNSEFSATVKAHIYVGSKLSWECIGGSAPQYHEDIT